MTFEFDLEVRPEFDLPEWKGLKIDRPVREFTAADVHQALNRLLTNRGHLDRNDRAAAVGDYLTLDLTFKTAIRFFPAPEEVIRLRPVLSFRDGKIEGFDTAMTGVRAGETRELATQLSDDAPNAVSAGSRLWECSKCWKSRRCSYPS